MSKKTPSKGIAHLGVIIAIVVVVAAVAFGGWYVWDKNRDGGKQANNSNDDSQAGNTQTKQNQEPSDPSEGGKYLVVTEWGIRFELPAGLSGDVNYGLATTDSTGDQTANFEIGEISRLPGSNCKLTQATDPGASGTIGGVVSVSRYSDQLSSDQASLYKYQAHVGNYWYYIAPMRDACFATDQDEFARLVGEIEKLAKAMEGLRQVQ